ncbi:MAG: hypothetical protein R3C68_06365, partial [Myxococcota bacterium]
MVDTLDGLLQLVDAGGAQVDGSTLTWNASTHPEFASLAPGSVSNASFTARITTPLADGTIITNQAEVRSPNIPEAILSDDPALGGLQDPTVLRVGSAPNLSEFTKSVADITADPLSTAPGDQLQYELIVSNTGDAPATQVVVRDPLPTEAVVQVPANARLEAGALVWDATSEPALAQVVPGSPVVLRFVMSVNDSLPNGTLVLNQAFVTSAEVSSPEPSDDPDTADVDDVTQVMVISGSDLGGSSKVVTELFGTPLTEVRPGTQVRYRIRVHNRGNATAQNVRVVDAVPADLSIDSALGGRVSGQQVVWDGAGVAALQNLLAGESVELDLEATVNSGIDGTLIANQASLSADDLVGEILTDADLSTLTKEPTLLTLRANVDLSTRRKVFVDPSSGAVLNAARPGDAVRVLVTVGNAGDGAAANVVVEDLLDSSVLTATTVRDGGVLNGNTVTWSLPRIDAGAEVVLRVDALIRTPLDPTTLSNQAFISVDGEAAVPTDDPSQPGSDDPTLLVINSAADLTAVSKDVVGVLDRQVAPGETFDYRIDLDNRGDGNAFDVR